MSKKYILCDILILYLYLKFDCKCWSNISSTENGADIVFEMEFFLVEHILIL